MNLSPETKNIQSKFALYCRTGIPVELPGTTPNRLHHYRRLVFNIIKEHLESTFPIASEFTDSKIWDEMLNDFFSKHDCQNYQVWKIAGEFCNYAIETKFAETFNIPYLNDLLRFEWEELAVYNMEDIPVESYKEKGNILNDILIVNPEHQLLQLQYPVHIYHPADSIDKPGNYFVLLYREKETGNVQFLDISIWFALIIEQLGKGEVTLQSLLNEAPKLFGEINLEELTNTTIEFINDLKQKKFVLGFKK